MVKEDCVIEDVTGSAILHIWDELVGKVQNSKSYSLKNPSVKNYSGNTMLETTVSTVFNEVQTDLEQVKGPDLLENSDKKVTVQEFNLWTNLTFTCSVKLNLATKRFRTTSLQILSNAHRVVQLRKQRHQRKPCQQDFVLMLMAMKYGSLHSLMSCKVFLTTRKNLT